MWMSGGNALFVQFKTRMTYRDMVMVDLDSLGKYVLASRKDNRTHISICGEHRGTLCNAGVVDTILCGPVGVILRI